MIAFTGPHPDHPFRRNPMRTLLASLAALVLSAATGSAPAVAGHYVDVNVIDRDTGQTATVYAHDGQYWIAGTPGHRYAVRLINRSGERVLAVLSVDGVNAVSGETASAQQTGYVLAPWQQTEVAGWRKSLSDIAAFEFTALSNSYAARTGRPDNVGVIGVAVFRERQPQYRPYDDAISSREAPASRPRAQAEKRASAGIGSRDSAARAPAPVASMPQESLGTGHGEREWSHARQVAFQRDSRHPVEVTALRYDSHPNLVAMGVIARPYHRHHEAPEPFPIGFVPDPY
jgi:hypothetical protein